MKRTESTWRLVSLLLIGLGAGLFLGAIILAGITWSNANQQNRDAGAANQGLNSASGTRARDFTLQSLTGETVRLTDLQGKPVLINFWATWCPPCREEMPLIQKYFTEHEPELVVLAINFDETEPVVKGFVDEMGLTFTVLLDPGGKVSDLYRVRGYPTTIFLDAEGIIRAQHIGSFKEEALIGYLREIGLSN